MGKHDNEGVQTGFEVYTGDAGCDHGRIAQIDILYQRTALLSQPHCPRREQRGQQATLLYRHLQPQTPALPTETTAVAASDSPSLAHATTNTLPHVAAEQCHLSRVINTTFSLQVCIV